MQEDHSLLREAPKAVAVESRRIRPGELRRDSSKDGNR